ncbi:MAG: hypothetical protein ACRBN8_22440 [Nannocystales bacterium]
MQQILSGGGAQTLSFTPDERADASPAPAWSLEDMHEEPDSDARVLASGDAVVDSTAVPITTDIGPGLPFPRELELPASGLVPGRAYVLEDHDGASERVFVAQTALTSAELVTPVRGYFPTGSVLRGVTLSADIPEPIASDTDLVQDENALMLSWTFHVRGQIRRVTELARVVVGTGVGRYTAAVEADIAEDWPELVEALERSTQSMPRMVKHAEKRIATRLRAKNIDPEKFMAGPQGFDLLVSRTLLHFAQQGLYPRSRDAEIFVEERKAEYVSLWNDLVIGTPGRDVVERDNENTTAAPHSRKRRNPFKRA